MGHYDEQREQHEAALITKRVGKIMKTQSVVVKPDFLALNTGDIGRIMQSIKQVDVNKVAGIKLKCNGVDHLFSIEDVSRRTIHRDYAIGPYNPEYCIISVREVTGDDGYDFHWINMNVNPAAKKSLNGFMGLAGILYAFVSFEVQP